MEHFFSPNSSGHLRSDAHQSQTIGGDADVDYTQTIGGIQSNYWGGYILPIPFVFRHPWVQNLNSGMSVFDVTASHVQRK